MNGPQPAFEPFMLEICLPYRGRGTREEAGTPALDRLKRVVDVLARQSRERYIQDRFKGRVKMAFTGSEPLGEFELLKGVVGHIRARAPEFGIEVVTGGASLTESRMDFFARNDVEVALSLDGHAFQSALDGLRKIISNEEYRAHIHVSATLTSQTIDRLPEVVRAVRHAAGIKQLEIGLEAHEMWGRAGLDRLRSVLRRVKSRFLAALAQGADSKGIESVFREFLFSGCEEADYHELAGRDIALFHDGCFYPSAFAVKPSLERRYRVGDLEHGIDFKRIRAISSSPLIADISRKCRYRAGLLSPVERYCRGAARRFAPDRLSRLLENTSQVNKVFHEEMEGFRRLQKIYERLVGTRSFGDLAHPPRYRSDREIRRFRLAIRNDSDIGRLREGVDYFLYSPGSVKNLTLGVAGRGACSARAVDVMEGMILYVLAKAAFLKKRIRLAAEGDASASGADHRRYLNEHGVRAGDSFAGRDRLGAGQ